MAYAPGRYIGNGSTRIYTVPFNYLNKAHVKVYLNGVTTSAFSWLSSSQIQLNTAPASGVAILVQRETPTDSRAVTFAGVSALNPVDLDTNTNYLLNAIQERLFTGDDHEVRLHTAEADIVNAKADISSLKTRATTSETRLSSLEGQAIAAVAVPAVADILSKGPWVDPRAYGVKLDGVTDDSAAFQTLVNTLADAGSHTIRLFDKTAYLATPVYLPPGINVVGGTIKGSLHVGADQAAGVNPTNYRNPIIAEVRFGRDSLTAGTYGLRYSMAANAGSVFGCTFENLDVGIWVPPLTVTLPNQFVTRLTVANNKYDNCNYFVKTDPCSPMQFGAADFAIVGNVGEAKIDNLHLENFDGALIANNVFFQEGHGGHSTIKGYNVYLKHVNWMQLTNNNYFEAGLDGIHVEYFNNVTITGGSIAYPGQRTPSCGIWMGGGIEGGMNGCNSSVTGVTIQWPSLSGIKVASGSCNKISILGNFIENAGGGPTPPSFVYYGATDLSTLDHYGIDVHPDANFISVKGNISPSNLNNLSVLNLTCSFSDNLDSSKNSGELPRILTLSGTETTVNTPGVTEVRFAQSAPTTVLSVSNGSEGQRLTFIAFNGNTTLHDTATFKLRGRVDTTMPAGCTLTMVWVDDCWREVCRNYPDSTITTAMVHDLPADFVGYFVNYTLGGSSKFRVNQDGTVVASQFKLSALNGAPATSTSAGSQGEIKIDANYLYFCVADNTWKRTPLSTW